ncbi:MAG: class I SAM-dependent methyltransferase [Candidatus Omnitrophica bacterium]|nr:class I SAM-dependent methyltransferase [Candidatus Omnitrophota bacterium]
MRPNFIEKLYRRIHKKLSVPAEREEYSGGYWQRRVREEAIGLCGSLGAGRLVEIGCGEGLFMIGLAARNPSVLIQGIDNNAARLKMAAGRCAAGNFKNINLMLLDAKQLPLPSGQFDTAVSVNVFFNMESLEAVTDVLKEMKRVCKNSGRIIFDFRNSLNPLLTVKYKLARYYDSTVKDLPLNTYEPRQIEGVLNDLGLEITRKRFIGFPVQKIAPIIVIEAKNRC